MSRPGLAPYVDRPRVQRDVAEALSVHQSLRFKSEQHVHNNGVSETLLQLHGTVPIQYRGARYNIPVKIVFLAPYPRQPPLAYVTPTPDMRIKPRHKHVDEQGVVYLPFLNQWNPAASNILALTHAMSAVFSEDPPVYRYTGQPPPGAQPAPSYPTPYAKQPTAASPTSYPPAAQQPAHYPKPVPQAGASARTGAGNPFGAADQEEQLRQQITIKLQQRLSNRNKKTTKCINELFETQSKLNENASRATKMLEAYQLRHDNLTKACSDIEQYQADLASWLQKNENSAEIDVDAATQATDSWSNQLLELAAEDNAISDAMEALDKALQDDAINTSDFIKQMRNLGRKQFMARALCIKVFETQKHKLGAK